jgi:glycerol-3-phosphate dehydrogenase
MGEVSILEGTTNGAVRARGLVALSAQEWDLVIIGGGITGAGVAQQAARRGWKVLLVEQRDFAWGTSSRSSKLVHGGLRYLKEGDLKTTLHSVRERERLMREAPELVQAQSFLFADCKGRKPGRWLFQLGLTVYDIMAGQRSHFYADLARTRALVPGLNPPAMRGALVFNDAKTDDARLVQRVLMEAQHDGALALNYVAAQELVLTHGRVSGLVLQDVITGQAFRVRAKSVVNATGAWADKLRANLGAKPMLRPLRGSHLVVPHKRLPVEQSISMMHVRDGRPVFLYPWEGSTLIGTTDLDHQGDLNVEARISQAEVDYLMEAVNEQFPQARLTESDVTAVYAGVRPVVDDGKGAASKATRDHVVRDESGLITLTGGKLTTFRLMAQDALKLAAPHAGKHFARDEAVMFTPASCLAEWSEPVRQRLSARYGLLAAQRVVNAKPEDLQFIPNTQTLWVELAVAAQYEAVVHLDDLLLRRTRLGILLPRGGLDHLARILSLCEPHLQWGDKGWDSELTRYRALIAQHYALPQRATSSPN